jgi:hypothetical protein
LKRTSSKSSKPIPAGSANCGCADAASPETHRLRTPLFLEKSEHLLAFSVVSTRPARPASLERRNLPGYLTVVVIKPGGKTR